MLLPGEDGRPGEQLIWWGGAASEQFQPEGGVNVPVNLDQLIERIYVGPGVPGYAPALLRDLLARYGLGGKEVTYSSLDQPPFDHISHA